MSGTPTATVLARKTRDLKRSATDPFPLAGLYSFAAPFCIFSGGTYLVVACGLLVAAILHTQATRNAVHPATIVVDFILATGQ